MTQSTPEIRKRHAVLFGIHGRSADTKFSVFGYQSEDRFIFLLMKTKHPVHIIMFGVVTSDSDVILSFIFYMGFKKIEALKHLTKIEPFESNIFFIGKE